MSVDNKVLEFKKGKVKGIVVGGFLFQIKNSRPDKEMKIY